MKHQQRGAQVKTISRRGLVLVGVLMVGGWLSASALAQGGGQMCVRAFEDRNANAQRDSGEPFLTYGVSVELFNAENVVIDSALVEDSPRAAQGMICFQGLGDGEYGVSVASSDYRATTTDSFRTAVSADGIPVVFDYGAQRIIAQTTPAAPVPEQPTADDLEALLTELAQDERFIERVFLASLGALVVFAVMGFLGTLAYVLLFRRRLRRLRGVMEAQRRTGSLRATTGNMAPVTDEERRFQRPR